MAYRRSHFTIYTDLHWFYCSCVQVSQHWDRDGRSLEWHRWKTSADWVDLGVGLALFARLSRLSGISSIPPPQSRLQQPMISECEFRIRGPGQPSVMKSAVQCRWGLGRKQSRHSLRIAIKFYNNIFIFNHRWRCVSTNMWNQIIRLWYIECNL